MTTAAHRITATLIKAAVWRGDTLMLKTRNGEFSLDVADLIDVCNEAAMHSAIVKTEGVKVNG